MTIEKRIIDAALANGASLAGIANMQALRRSPSHTIYTKMGEYKGIGTVKEGNIPSDIQLFDWPDSAESVLVIGLSHPEDKPELDWWDGRGTPGNRILIDIINRTKLQIEQTLKITTRKVHYYVEKGGLFLKDAAVLSGLGVIGKNNMLVTPQYGPIIRLRALLLNVDAQQGGPISFDPCAHCDVRCRKVCPENAMDEKARIFKSGGFPQHLPARDGAYDRVICNIRMEKDFIQGGGDSTGEETEIRYCRKCEFVCPVGKNRVR